ncbi:uncharacterized protein LOC120345137 isoform X2 [Styela clava]|uniref:uncharacterized protein LOC120345137 isoform X2 n=1 Tax=Styela clava TaxID=7725 RepID=UPI0019398F90|nr:uncharacterized protein LOC120345137 isoform X2 [Styela clava]
MKKKESGDLILMASQITVSHSNCSSSQDSNLESSPTKNVGLSISLVMGIVFAAEMIYFVIRRFCRLRKAEEMKLQDVEMVMIDMPESINMVIVDMAVTPQNNTFCGGIPPERKEGNGHG